MKTLSSENNDDSSEDRGEDPFDCFGSDSDSESVTLKEGNEEMSTKDNREQQTKMIMRNENHENDNKDDSQNVNEQNNNDATDQHKKIQSMVNDANIRISSRIKFPDNHDHTINNDQNKHDNDNIDNRETTIIDYKNDNKLENSWPHRAALYHGPMELTMEGTLGGGRGYVASKDLKAGTLVLVEECRWTWPKDQIGKELGLVSILALVFHSAIEMEQSQSQTTVIMDMEELHPTRKQVHQLMNDKEGKSIDSFSQTEREQIILMMEELQSKYQINTDESTNKNTDVISMQRVLSTAKNKHVTNSDGSELTSNDILRMLLALRYNGFDSGLYLHFAMFNHSDDPNCIKFRPDNSDGGESQSPYPPSSPVFQKKSFSEVRTTRNVLAGESLTLHYLHPRETSHFTQRTTLWDQHRFDVGDHLSHLPQSIVQMYYCNGSLPHSSYSPSSSSTKHSSLREIKDLKNNIIELTKFDDYNQATKSVEQVIEEFETQYEKTKNQASVLMNNYSLVPDQFSNEEYIREAIDEIHDQSKIIMPQFHKLEDELYDYTLKAPETLLNDKHILLARCYTCYINTAYEFLPFLKTLRKSWYTGLHIGEKGRAKLVTCRILVVARKLLELQLIYMRKDHVDVGKTYRDIANCVSDLLSNGVMSRHLMDLRLDGLSTFGECSMYENYCMREYWRIKDLYPRDVEEKVQSQHEMNNV